MCSSDLAVMAPAAAGEDFSGAEFCGQVTADTKIEDLAHRVVDQPMPLAVTDGDGAVIGQLTREAVLGVLVHKPDPKAAPAANNPMTVRRSRGAPMKKTIIKLKNIGNTAARMDVSVNRRQRPRIIARCLRASAA